MFGKPLRVSFLKGLLFFLISLLTLSAQGKLEGFVYDSQTDEPLFGANVMLEGTSYGAATDFEGKFTLINIPAGKYNLLVRYVGYTEKSIEINIQDNRTLKEEIKLDFQVIEGEVVTITAQAEGQIQAINQQLTSNTIANVVSEARIKELPDVNAAESIGRLPGVSIERSGGEATKVAIRGLSPKYNTVTVNGVRVPSTGGDDRSVDLSLISSNMLDGIEVKKAITPDMDADALGGTVDLKLKEAPVGFKANFSAQGGYTKLQDDYGNYSITGGASNRFFDNQLGVIASFNFDRYNRSADKFQGDYRQQTVVGTTDSTEIIVSQIQLREENVERRRAGASLALDFKIPEGKITANGFYNRLSWDQLNRVNMMSINDNRHYYFLRDNGGSTDIFTGGIGIEQDFDWMSYDLSISRTSTETEAPGEREWTFIQESNAFSNIATINANTPANMIPTLATNDSNKTGLADMYVYDTNRDEHQTAFQLNLKFPFTMGKDLNGYVKTGVKFTWLDRMNNEEQHGRNGLQYGNGTGPNTILTVLDQLNPDLNIESSVDEFGLLPIWTFASDYSRNDFLEGEYPLGFTVDEGMLQNLMDDLASTNEYLRYAIGSRGRDYSGDERYSAGYIMSEVNFGKYITFIPGIRYESDWSEYTGQTYREVTRNNIQQEPADLDTLVITRENEFWLPMLHLNIKPTDWLSLRMAYTHTLTRPDFIQLAPISSINSYQNYARVANSSLKPAKATNWDISASVYENYIGLFTVSGFYKSIDDLIFQTRYQLRPGIPIMQGWNIPEGWVEANPDVDTYINNQYEAIYKGFELDWQTNFWYLPSFLKGLVLNINFTNISSEIEKQLYYVGKGDFIEGAWPPRRENIVIDSSRIARMPGQPKQIFNITIGYDYKDFSARLSYLYQTNKVTYIDYKPELDNFSGDYARWDLTLQQKLPYNVQIYTNFTNLNGRPDRNLRGDALVDPTYIEYYGFTMDVGVRYRFE
jgi:TonB-dependent receptor